ncbi:MAG: HAMP domain-containing sensor histidine kinase [Bacillota bacterium]|nr:HAMP domain-containing sensor histidine kinase [Bacillota bacterium]MDW7678613.1 HAMP domain-containing sensor histidine kinase [Bacillota bacterium]
MDTKWKSIKESTGLKVGAYLLAWSSFMVMAGGGMTLMILRWYRYWQVQPTLEVFRWPMLAALPVFLASLVYLTLAVGHSLQHNKEQDSLKAGPLDWLYTDLHTLLVLLAAGLSLGAAALLISIAGDNIGHDNFTIFGLLVVLGIDGIIGLSYYLSMVRHVKRKTLFSHTLLGSLLRKIRERFRRLFSYRRAHVMVMLMVLVYGFLNGILGVLFSRSSGGFFLVMVMFNTLVLIGLIKPFSSFAAVMQATHHIAHGDIDYPLNPEKMALPLQELGQNVASIQTGLKQAVGEAIKGERMKTELITNVSHDLKTPLTSVINYVDLLKKENDENETAQGYLKVLTEKTERLKKLIDDLLEASRASSGNVQVQLAAVDLQEILLQVEGEFEERLSDAGLELQLVKANEPVTVVGDGNCLWRILDNLMSNVLKYSMTGTRIYLSAENRDRQGILTIKNVSSTQLNVNPEELMERFVRGDESRTEEGSGLGLAIARGLAQAQQGSLDISIDGDLFKTVLSLPAVMEI